MKFMTILIVVLAANLNLRAGEGPIEAKAAPARHLFILSGQSNMHHMKSGTFDAAVKETFGEKNVTVVKSAKTGAPIRSWDKDYQWPEDRAIPQGRKRPGEKEKTREEFMQGFGGNYDALMAAVRKSKEGKTYDTVTFVWMQGESDTNKQGVDQYFESFNRVVTRLKSDLGIESIHMVIGRLSDYGMQNPNWVKMRELQVNYAEQNPNCEWVDCDDLNDVGENGEKKNDLHYTKEGYDTLGKRFAEKAIELIKKRQVPSEK